VGLGSRRDTAEKLVSLRQRHGKVGYFIIFFAQWCKMPKG